MAEWELEPEDLKHYPHFDADISIDEARALVTNPGRVATNAFYPFIKYEKVWQPFRSKDPRPDRKSRLIRYAARKDAYILAYYRSVLANIYEQQLSELGISDCPIAYRKILKGPLGQGGKCNIDFAKEAFDAIEAMGECCFIALDISKFFESLDHKRLRTLWCSLLGVEELPVDHEKVFRAVTKYAFVDRTELYRRLNFFGQTTKGGKLVEGYLVKFKDIPKKLCSNKVFRDKVVGEDKTLSTIIEVNPNEWGVPQGAPISDLLANIYLMDFDIFAKKLADELGGLYRRYSDDILFVVPVSREKALEVEKLVIIKISEFGDQLKIKPEKTSIVAYFNGPNGLGFEHIKGKQGKNGAEYLGFRFDGKKIFLRDSTVSGLFRKMARSAKAHCRKLKERFPGKDKKFLEDQLATPQFIENFGRVEDFDDHPDVKDWTFWTYARHAVDTLGSKSFPIYRQLSNHKKFMVERLARGLE